MVLFGFHRWVTLGGGLPRPVWVHYVGILVHVWVMVVRTQIVILLCALSAFTTHIQLLSEVGLAIGLPPRLAAQLQASALFPRPLPTLVVLVLLDLSWLSNHLGCWLWEVCKHGIKAC